MFSVERYGKIKKVKKRKFDLWKKVKEIRIILFLEIKY